MGLIGKELFAIGGVKLPGNASKERSGRHAELLHRANRLEKAAAKIIRTHQAKDESKGEQDLEERRRQQVQRIHREALSIRAFVKANEPKTNAKGQELKSNATDNDSAKMATSKGVIQGYAAQAAVDSTRQVIVAADVAGSGSEQANLQGLQEQNTPARIADNGMRKRDERFRDQGIHKAKADLLYDKGASKQEARKLFKANEFRYDKENNRCVCPAGKALYSSGTTSGSRASRCGASARCRRSGRCTAWCITLRRSGDAENDRQANRL
jgi:hypothetical protein